MEEENEEKICPSETESKLDLGSIGKKRRFYTSAEVSAAFECLLIGKTRVKSVFLTFGSQVACHNCATDCWVVVHGRVYDLSQITSEVDRKSDEFELVKPLLMFGGKDISDWFDDNPVDVKQAVDEESGLIFPTLPHGRFLGVPPSEPVSNWATDFDKPWWKDTERFCIGSISKHVRTIKIVNMLTYQETLLEVCEEETLAEIEDRYQDWNENSTSYKWKYLDGDAFRYLDMQATLSENSILDETELLHKLSIDANTFIPTIHAYFADEAKFPST